MRSKLTRQIEAKNALLVERLALTRDGVLLTGGVYTTLLTMTDLLGRMFKDKDKDKDKDKEKSSGSSKGFGFKIFRHPSLKSSSSSASASGAELCTFHLQ